MSNDRREEIIMATLELAAQNGLGSVSMNMVADKVGIKKSSLYNHFSSREEIVEAMYQYLREQAKEKSNVTMVDYSTMFANKSALEILQQVVHGYIQMNQQEQMQMFYKVIYSERCIQPMAAKIMAEETEKMLFATKQLFYAMEVHHILHFENADLSAVSFAMTIHGLMEYEMDKSAEDSETQGKNKLMDSYLQYFCEENRIGKKVEL